MADLLGIKPVLEDLDTDILGVRSGIESVKIGCVTEAESRIYKLEDKTDWQKRGVCSPG